MPDSAEMAPSEPPSEPLFEVLEPRIMLNANLEWDFAPSTGYDNAEAMLAMLGAFEAEFDTLIADLQDQMLTELGDAAPLFLLESDAPDTGLGRLQDVMLRIEGAVDAVTEGVSDQYDALLDSIIDNAALQAQFAVGNELSLQPTRPDALQNLGLTRDFLFSIFSSDGLAQSGSLAALEAHIAGIDPQLVFTTPGATWNPTFVTNLAQTVVTTVSDAFDNVLSNAERQEMYTVALTDLTIDGIDVVDFTQGASDQEVSVSIVLPSVETLLDQLGHHPDLRMPLPVDFGFADNGAGTVSFDMTARVIGSVTDVADFTVDNFATDHIFDLGGDLPFLTPPDVATGFLPGTLASYETADLFLGFDWTAGTSIVGTAEYRDTDPTDNIANTLAANFDFEITPVDGVADDALLDTDYLLVRFNVDSQLPLGDASTTLFDIDTALTVTGQLGALGQAQTTAERFAASTALVDFTDGSGTLPPVLQTNVLKLADTLFNTTSQTFSAFFAGLGAGIANLLTTEQISVGVPLTDIDIMDGFDAIAAQFAALGESFFIQPGQLGFDSTNGYAIESEISEQTGIVLDEAALAYLANIESISIDVFGASLVGAGPQGPQVQPVTINLSSLDPFDAAGGLRSDFLTEFAALLNTALGTYGWTVQAIGGALSFSSTTPASTQLFRITGQSERDGNDPTDPDFTFAAFGLTERMLRQFDGVNTTGVTSAISETYDVINLSFGRESVALGALDPDVLIGMQTLRLAVSVDGVPQVVDIDQPNTGWGTAANVAAEIQSAFNMRGIAMLVGTNPAGNGLSFAHNALDDTRFTVGLDENSLARVQDFQGLLAWTNDQLSALLPGATLEMFAEDDPTKNAVAGDIRLTMDPQTASVDYNDSGLPGTRGQGALRLDDLGFGEIDGLTLNAALDASIEAELNLAAQINIFDLQEDFIDGGEVLGSIPGLVLQNAQIIDLSLDADFRAEAAALTGTAEMGLIEFGLGLNNASQNFAVFDASLDVSAVGEDNAVFGETVSFGQLVNIFGGQVQVGTDASGDPILAPVGSGLALANLVGRFNLTGNIITDEDGCALTDTNDRATSIADMDIFADGDTLDAGETRSMVYFNFGDVSANLGGINEGDAAPAPSLTAPVIGLSIGNIFDPFGTAKVCADLGDYECLVPLAAGAILDGLAGLGDLLDAYSENLATQLAFLTVDVPLLNASILDGLDFTTDFLQGIDDLRANPDFNLGTIERLLQETFGGDVSLMFENCVLQFDMSLDYLTDYSETVAFNLSLSDLMSEADLLAAAGPDLAQVLSGLVDARGDAELVFDPDISLDLSFGLDLSQIKPTLDLAELSTPLDHVINAYGLRLNEPPPTELTASWRDAGTGDSGSADVDINGANSINDVVDLLVAGLMAGVPFPDLAEGYSFDIEIERGTSQTVTVAADPNRELPADPNLTEQEFADAIRDQIQEFSDALRQALLSIDITTTPPDPTPDLRIVWEDTTVPASGTVDVDLDSAETVQDVLDLLNAQLGTLGGNTVSASFVDGQIVLSDTNTGLTQDPDVIALFGSATAESDTGVEPNGLIAFDPGFTDYTAAFTFDIVMADGEPQNVSLAADPARTTIEGFAAALNTAFLSVAVDRTDLSDTGIPGTQVALFQLLRVSVDGGNLVLKGTNFAELNGFDVPSFKVQGKDIGHDVTFELKTVGGSNALQAFGFTADEVFEDEARSATLYDTPNLGRPILFVDTGPSGTKIRGDITLGAPDGLNMVIALGPVEAAVENGQAFIGGEDGSSAGFIEATIIDVDGTDDGRLDLVSLIDIAKDPARSFLDLFGLEVELYTNVELPFSGALGLLQPDQHGFTYQAALLETITDPTTFTNLYTITDEASVRSLFQGDAVELYFGGQVPDMVDYPRIIDLRLPDFGGLFDCADVFQLLNDPEALLGGLDMIFATIQTSIDTYLADIDLPIIGNNFGLAAQFFRDLRFDVIDPARDWVAAGNPDGSRRTTEDLVEDFLNPILRDMLRSIAGNTIAADEQIIQLETDDSDPDDPFIYGAISFPFKVFEEALDIGFDLDIPGLALGVDDASAITLTGELVINLGFGLDCSGFFLLNDLDTNELGFVLTADAGALQAQLNIADVMGVDASTNPGDAVVRAQFGIDLFGAGGEDLSRDYSALNLQAGGSFENTIYLPQLDFNDFAAFKFDTTIHLDLAMEIKVLDPTKTDGSEYTVNIGGEDRAVFPTLLTNFQFDAVFDPLEYGADLLITKMQFFEVSINIESIYSGLLAPIFDPVLELIKPLDSLLSFLEVEPFSYVLGPGSPISQIFPVLGMLDSIPTIKAAFNGGPICIGTYDFLGYAPGNQIFLSEFNINNARFTPCFGLSLPTLPDLSAQGPGIVVEVPLLTDPAQAFRLLTGNFAAVDLVTVEFLLLDANFELDLFDDIISQLGLPGWASSAIRGGLDAYMILDLYAGMTIGYDMSGIVNFVNTFDVARLLDGAYIDAAPGSLVAVDIGGRISLNAGIAGASAALSVKGALNFNDPNDDGRLRLAELLRMVEFAADNTGLPFDEFAGIFFEGFIDVDAALRVWAGINLPWPLPDLRFSTTVFDLGSTFDYTLKPTSLGPFYIDDLNGGTQVLNIGANAAASLLRNASDGNEKVVLNGYNFELNNVNVGTISQGGLIIPVGNGNNIVNMSNLGAGVNTVTYAGKGNDTIQLASTGIHVIFAGDGADNISGGSDNGTYIIFTEGGADTVNVAGKNVIVIGGDDFGMRDRFMQTFANGGLDRGAILQTLGLVDLGGGQVGVAASGAANYKLNGAAVSLATLLNDFTAETQLGASRDVETVTIAGTGRHIVLTGAGDDVVFVNSGASAFVASGAGSDQLNVLAANTTVEGGAGADLIALGNGLNTAWGWGAQGELDANTHLVRSDGDDVIVGGDQADQLHGQYGRDVIAGGLGDDTLTGGHGNDLISGGNLTIFEAQQTASGIVQGNRIFLHLPTALEELQTRLLVETEIGVADGTDSIDGGAGSDVLFGGAGMDDITGGAAADILVGDYGTISVAANRLAETFISTGMGAAGAGSDTLDGGQGDDILVAGGSDDTVTPEMLSDTIGNNIIFGDFGLIEGTRILEQVDAYRALASNFGTRDVIQAGSGNDVIIGGERDDTIDSGLGADIVFGDNGAFVVGDGMLMTDVSALDGNDSIDVGTGTGFDKLDLVFGGAGDDTINGTTGGLIAMADYGTLEVLATPLQALFALSPLPAGASSAQVAAQDQQLDLIATIFKSMSSVPHASSGNDSVTLDEGLSYLVLGGGNDTASLGDGVSHVIGDDGTLRVDRPMNGEASVTAETTNGLNAGADSITTAEGRDIILGGDLGDTIDAGEGLNVVLTDNGRITASIREDALPARAESREEAADGADVYTGGDDTDIVILGGDSDSADLEDGLNYVLGDNGFLEAVPQATGPDRVTVGTVDSANTGAETLNGGADRDVIIGGGGADSLTTGDGVNAVLGDNGSVEALHVAGGSLPLSVTAREGSAEGNDTVTGGGDTDLVGLGLGDDSADLGAGDNRVLGDLGTITTSGALGDDAIRSSDTSLGGNDTITTAGGADVVVAGEGADSVTSGTGRDIALGDAGSVVFGGAGNVHSASADTTSHGGADTIDLGGGNDIAIGGLGDDSITVGDGEDIAMGDVIDLTFRNQTDLETVTLTLTDMGGEDTITAEGTLGDNILMGQFGADTIIGGDDDDWIIGDLANLVLQSVAQRLPGQSALDRITLVEHGESGVAFDDVLEGRGGADFMLGGFGADTLLGGDGQDFLFGDTIKLERSLTVGPFIVEQIDLETNLPFVLGGRDAMNGEDGPDVVIGGLGPDLFFGNTEDDILIGDSFAAEFRMILPSGFTGPNGERELVQGNFPGFGPNDILSTAQYRASIGVYFSTTGFFNNFADIGYTPLSIPGAPQIDTQIMELLVPIQQFLRAPTTIEMLGMLLQFDTDPTLVEEELRRAFLILLGVNAQSASPLQLELFQMMLQRVQDEMSGEMPTKSAA